MASKYCYNGIPLLQFCKDKKEYNAIIQGICRKKKSKKYEKYSEQEIINMTVESYGNNVKYKYNGVQLRRYCLDNNLNIQTIYTRIQTIKKINPSLTDDELVTLAVDQYEYNSVKYFYQGQSLIEFCRNNPKYSYSTIVDYVLAKQTQNPSLTIDQAIDLYFSTNHDKYRYYYLGIPLKKYCELNEINYNNIINYIQKHKSDPEYEELSSNQELIEKVMLEYHPFKPIYYYKGILLFRYCKDHNLKYSSIVSYLNRNHIKQNIDRMDDLIEEAIDTINQYGIIYYYDGIPLKDYCLQNQLNVHSIRANISQMRKINNDPLQDIINTCVENYKKTNIKYFYKGELLISFCARNGICYGTILARYYKLEALDENLDTNKAIESIVDDYLINQKIERKKYYYGDTTLSKYCNQSGYIYSSIYQRIKRMEKNKEYENDIQIIEMSIQRYEQKLEISQIKDALTRLDNSNFSNLAEICEILKIDFNCILDLIEMDFTYIQAVNMVWYFSDLKNSHGNKVLSDNKLNEILELARVISTSSYTDISQLSLYNLIGIYKSRLYDTRNEILIKQYGHMRKIIFLLCAEYNIVINSDIFNEMLDEMQLIFLEIINCICLNTEGQIVKYLDMTAKGSFRNYLKKYQKDSFNISLEQPLFNDSSKTMLNFIGDESHLITPINKDEFSQEIMNLLQTLSEENLKFILMRFQEDYTLSELAEIYNASIEEIKQREEYILNLLRNQKSIKKIIKISKES